MTTTAMSGVTVTEEQKLTAEQTLEEHIAQIIDQQIFHPPNLTEDEQLRSNIDPNGFMPLTFITRNRHIESLTSDVRRIKEGIRLSRSIQVSEDGFRVKVDLQPRRNTLILRDQPDNATQKDIEQIFEDPNCAKFRDMRPDISNTWFVTFESEEECMRTVLYLQRERGMSVGVKTSVHPLAEHGSPKSSKSPSKNPTAQPTAGSVDILSSATVPASATSPEYYPSPPGPAPYQDSDFMSRVRNPYRPYVMVSGPPVGPVYPADTMGHSPPMQAMMAPPSPQQAIMEPPLDLPLEVPNGDYVGSFAHYQRGALVEIYQQMLVQNKLYKPNFLRSDPDIVSSERLESTMVQKAKNPSQRKPRGDKNRNHSHRRRSPRGRNPRSRDRPRRGSGGPPPPPPGPLTGMEMPFAPMPYYADEYYEFGRGPKPQFQEGFYDTMGAPNYGHYDDGYQERAERRPRRSPRGKGQSRGGRDRDRGRGRANRGKNQPRREYRPVGSGDSPSQFQEPSAADMTGSPNRPNRGRSNPRSPANARRGSKRGRQKLVYRPKESS